MRPCATDDRRKTACSMPGRTMSSTQSPPAREKAGIFQARDRGTEIARAHRVPLRALAASSAASTMA